MCKAIRSKIARNLLQRGLYGWSWKLKDMIPRRPAGLPRRAKTPN